MSAKSELITLEEHNNFDNVDKPKLMSLIKDSFDRELAADYFSCTKPEKVIIARANTWYLGTVIIEKIEDDIDYLDKIAVAKIFQGNGLGKKMWELMDESSKKLVWRAKEINPINEFYKRQCDGMHKSGKWIIYWKGLNIEEIKIGIKYALSKKETLREIKWENKR
jgi:acetylglutamate synthase